jgi:predicted dehydrogenase
MVEQLRIGVLGAARIAPNAVLEPALSDPEVTVTAIAARDTDRARSVAEAYGISRVHDSYEALLADPDVDAVYNPLPNGLHGRWSAAALEAGKHVLCEKPFTANAEEAEAVAAVAARTGLVVMEAFHYRYHPFMTRALDVLASGRIGEVRRIETFFRARLRGAADIRWDLGLAGGALMDIGSYPVHLLRTLAGAEPTVVSAEAGVRSPGVDRWLRAELRFDDGRSGFVSASMLSRRSRASGARVTGSKGSLELENFTAPYRFNSLTWRTARRHRTEHVDLRPVTYAAQLRAFADAVLRGAPLLTGPADAVANMRLIDACYEAAGLPVRQPTAPW